MPKIDETLRKVAQGMQPAGAPKGQETSAPAGPGDPACPICRGIGFYRRDLPVGDPDFGRIEICSCRQAEVSRSVHNRLYAFANLESLRHFTFDSFLPHGKPGVLTPAEALSLEGAFNSSRRFASHLDGWLLITGPYGCGKTHLAAAIANQAVSLGVPTLFLTAPDLLDWLRFAFSDPEASYEQRFEEIRSIQLLVLDDFGTENATPWAQEKLFQILNYRYLNRLPMVVTTNHDLEAIEKRIQSRLQDPDLVQRVFINAPDFRNPKGGYAHPEVSSLSLHLEDTFDTFNLRKSEGLPAGEQETLAQALESARAFAAKPRGWLLLAGGYGTGKTHLAAAIGNACAQSGLAPIFVSLPDLMDHLRATFHPESRETYDERFDAIKTAPLLILDDLGGQNLSTWVKEKLYQLFNYRYVTRLPTVVTTSVALEKLDERLLTRLFDRRLCRILELNVTPFHRSAGKRRAARPAPRNPREGEIDY